MLRVHGCSGPNTFRDRNNHALDDAVYPKHDDESRVTSRVQPTRAAIPYALRPRVADSRHDPVRTASACGRLAPRTLASPSACSDPSPRPVRIPLPRAFRKGCPSARTETCRTPPIHFEHASDRAHRVDTRGVDPDGRGHHPARCGSDPALGRRGPRHPVRHRMCHPPTRPRRAPTPRRRRGTQYPRRPGPQDRQEAADRAAADLPTPTPAPGSPPPKTWAPGTPRPGRTCPSPCPTPPPRNATARSAPTTPAPSAT